MNWIKLYISWPRVSKEEGLKAKKIVLVNYIKPLGEELQKKNSVETWNYTFQGRKGGISTNTLLVLIGFKSEAKKFKEEIKQFLAEEMKLKEGENSDFTLKEEFPQRMADIWGDHFETFAKMKELSSKLAIEAVEEGLGEGYKWHKQENRPGHIWLNQLGCNWFRESRIYQGLAKGYLRHTIDHTPQPFREQLKRLEKKMEEAMEVFRDISSQ